MLTSGSTVFLQNSNEQLAEHEDFTLPTLSQRRCKQSGDSRSSVYLQQKPCVLHHTSGSRLLGNQQGFPDSSVWFLHSKIERHFLPPLSSATYTQRSPLGYQGVQTGNIAWRQSFPSTKCFRGHVNFNIFSSIWNVLTESVNWSASISPQLYRFVCGWSQALNPMVFNINIMQTQSGDGHL